MLWQRVVVNEELKEKGSRDMNHGAKYAQSSGTLKSYDQLTAETGVCLSSRWPGRVACSEAF